MEATIKLKLNEITPDFIKNLKTLFGSDKQVQITIQSLADHKLNTKETKEEYFARINNTLRKLQEGKAIYFSEQELDEYARKMTK